MHPRLEAAWILYRQDRYRNAEKEALAVLAEFPEDAEAQVLLALCLSRLRRFGAAVKAAKSALRTNPDWGYAHCTLSEVLFERGRYAEARRAIKEAIRIEPDDASYRGLLSKILRASGDHAGALVNARKARQLDPRLAWVVVMEGLSLLTLGRGREAEAAFRDSLQLDPGDAWAYQGLGRIALRDGNPGAAMDHVLEALRIDPNLEWAHESLFEAMLGKTLVLAKLPSLLHLIREILGQNVDLTAVVSFLAVPVAAGMAASMESTWPYPACVAVAAVFAVLSLLLFLSWAADPVACLLIAANRRTRRYLRTGEIRAAGAAAACLAVVVFAVPASVLTRTAWPALIGVGGLLSLSLVTTVFPTRTTGRQKLDERILTVFLALASAAVALVLVTEDARLALSILGAAYVCFAIAVSLRFTERLLRSS